MKSDIKRNLDMTALRSFVTVADHGGVTRAAGLLSLTQSAVSMQIKRLEDMLDTPLFDRRNRQLFLTTQGEQLLSYARRMLVLNDDAISRLMDEAFEGEITLGVPHDIVYPAIPKVLKTFAREFPRVKINLVSSFTAALHQAFEAGECDMILTTESEPRAKGQTISTLPLVFVGAPNGVVWRERPLRLAFEQRCAFRSLVVDALDANGVDWEMAVTSKSTRTIEASVSADLAVHAMLAGTMRGDLLEIDHGGLLPDLGMQMINLYQSNATKSQVQDRMAQVLVDAFQREFPLKAVA